MGTWSMAICDWAACAWLSFAAGQATYAQQRAMPGWGGRDGT